MKLEIYRRFNTIASKLAHHIIFTGSYRVWNALKDAISVVDVGCREGQTMARFKRNRKYRTCGVDGHNPYLKLCKMNGTHDDLIMADVRKLPLKQRTFDAVICLEVLQHLTKSDGQKFLTQLEEISRNVVVVGLPIGHYGQHEYDDNPLQEHKSQWEPREMLSAGYKVFVNSVRGIGGEWRRRGGGKYSTSPMWFYQWHLYR